MAGQEGRCLSEHGVMRLFAGAIESVERGELDGHLSHCERCAQLVAEAARTTGAGSAGLSDRMRPAVLSPGMLIANRYHVRRLLGIGAMGEVHEVDDTLIGTVVALKTLNAKLAGDAGALKRLKREVAAARSVTHPNVCRIFDLGSDSGHEALGAFAFLTMEYLSGVTLTNYLAAHGPYAPRDALPLLIQLADGLGAAHAAGIVHRDLKAENIMLVEAKSGGFRAIIMDFGLAGFDMPEEPGVEHGSGFSGTIAYAAPERIAGGRATPASDIYSFGLIAHEMLTNQRPLPGVARPRLTGDGVRAGAWERLLLRAIELDPKARFANGGELAEALRGLSDGARQPAWGRRRAAAMTAGASLVVIAGAAVTMLLAPGRAPSIAAATPPAAAAPPAAATPSAAAFLPATIPPPPLPVASFASALPSAAVRAAPHAERPVRRPPRRHATAPISNPTFTPTPAQAPAPARLLIGDAEDLLAGGDIARACELGEQAVRQAPDLAPARAFLGRCYMRLGRTSDARAHYARYLALMPDAPDAPFVRAIVGQDRP